jgi:hypothetical protein
MRRWKWKCAPELELSQKGDFNLTRPEKRLAGPGFGVDGMDATDGCWSGELFKIGHGPISDRPHQQFQQSKELKTNHLGLRLRFTIYNAGTRRVWCHAGP